LFYPRYIVFNNEAFFDTIEAHMSPQPDQQKLQENDFLVERFIGKLLDSNKIDQNEVENFRAVFQKAVYNEFEKSPKDRLLILARSYSAERERLNREIALARVEIPQVRSEDVLLQEIIDDEISRCRDIPPEKYEQAQVAIRSDVEYIIGTKVNDQVIRRLIQSAIADFCEKEHLTSFSMKKIVVPETPKTVSEEEIAVTKTRGVFEQPMIPVQKIEPKKILTTEYDLETEPPESFEEDSVRREILNQIKEEKPALATEAGMRHPHFFEAPQSPETEVEVERFSRGVVNPIPVSVPSKPKTSVLQKIFKVTPVVAAPAAPVQSEKKMTTIQEPIKRMDTPLLVQQPASAVVLPQAVPQPVLPQSAPQPVVQSTQESVFRMSPQLSRPSSDSDFETKDAFVEEEEPIFKTKVTSFGKKTSSEDGSKKIDGKKSLTEAFLAEARLADQSRPLSSNAAKNGVALETVRRHRNVEKQPSVSTPVPVPIDIPVPRKIPGERIVELKNTGNPERDLAAASNTRIAFDKSVEMSGEAIEDRHTVRNQEKNFFDKFIFEQISLIMGMIKSGHQPEIEKQLPKIHEKLMAQADAIADDDSQSISSRIAKLDALFQVEKKKYAPDSPIISPKSKADPIEDMVASILARLGHDLKTPEPNVDAQFKDTLHNALVFKAKQMQEAGFDEKSISKALNEAYTKNISFYLRGAG